MIHILLGKLFKISAHGYEFTGDTFCSTLSPAPNSG